MPPCEDELCANYTSNRLKRTCLESTFPLCSLLLQPFSLHMTPQMLSPTHSPTLHMDKEDNLGICLHHCEYISELSVGLVDYIGYKTAKHIQSS